MGLDGSHLKLVDLWLRLVVIPFSVAAIWIAVTTHQDNPDYGKLDFHLFTALKYMVCISGISAGYALFAAVASYLRCFLTKAWIFFLTDQVLAYLMVTSMAALVEFVYLLYNGDRMVSWSEACVSYGRFCSRLKLALALHLIAVSCFLLLAIISAYRVFRRFDPPVLHSKDEPAAATQEIT